jgi:alpha-tubulin suppressor-like RCC1 family protein
MSTASKITEILDLLNDGEWHKIREIEEKMRLEEKDIQQIVDFLKEYNFIVLEETKKAIKIEEKTRRFLVQKT